MRWVRSKPRVLQLGRRATLQGEPPPIRILLQQSTLHNLSYEIHYQVPPSPTSSFHNRTLKNKKVSQTMIHSKTGSSTCWNRFSSRHHTSAIPHVTMLYRVLWRSTVDINNHSWESLGVDATSNYSQRWSQRGPLIAWLPSLYVLFNGRTLIRLYPAFESAHISFSAMIPLNALMWDSVS